MPTRKPPAPVSVASPTPRAAHDPETGQAAAFSASSPSGPTRLQRGFVIEHQPGMHCPMLYCDRCGGRITQIGMAGVVYDRPKGKGRDWVGERSKITILCKTNHCLSAPQYQDRPWQELKTYLGDLLNNLGVRTKADWREFREFVERGHWL